MNAAYARLSARRERAAGAGLDAAGHERLCTLIEGGRFLREVRQVAG